jgi:peroxiredoxin
MGLNIDKKSIPAIVFFIAAMGLLIASVRTTTLAEKAAEDSRNGLIPIDKAQKAIDFTLPNVDASASTPPVNLMSAAKNTPVVFSFWASYCQYCPMEMSHLQQYAEKYKGKVQFYTVNSNDPPKMIKKYQALHGLSLPTLSDATHKVASDYGVDSLPTLFMIDKEGRVRYVANGFDPQMDSVFPKLLDSLLKES